MAGSFTHWRHVATHRHAAVLETDPPQRIRSPHRRQTQHVSERRSAEECRRECLPRALPAHPHQTDRPFRRRDVTQEGIEPIGTRRECHCCTVELRIE